jgi:hypothetical protein
VDQSRPGRGKKRERIDNGLTDLPPAAGAIAAPEIF